MELINILLKSYDTYSFFYKGKGVSWNDIYGSNNWRVRKTIVDKYKTSFGWIIKEADLPQMEEFALIVNYNSRHDADNVGCMGKICLDALKGKYVEDDSPKHLKMFCIIYDKSLEKNNFKFTIIKIK
jgi:hypothetical protein